MTTDNIIVCNSTIQYNTYIKEAKLNDLIIILGHLTYNISRNHITIPQSIHSASCKKLYIKNNEITVIYNSIDNYKKYILPINNKYNLPIIYIKQNNYHIFVTSYVTTHKTNKLINRIETQLLVNIINQEQISHKERVLIIGNFDYNFYEHPSQISTLCDNITCKIPRIFKDNLSTLDKFIFVKKNACHRNNNIYFKENICKYIM